MSELEDRLQAVLSDPAELDRLTQMASRLMGSLGDPPPEKAEDPPEPDSGGLSPALLSKVMGVLKGKGRAPLLDGVGPYLDEERRHRLERALRLASTARLAGSALEKLGGSDGL